MAISVMDNVEKAVVKKKAGRFGCEIAEILTPRVIDSIQEMPSPLTVQLATAKLIANSILVWIEDNESHGQRRISKIEDS